MEIKIEKLLTKLQAAIEGQYFEVGVLAPRAHKPALDKNQGMKNFAGGEARKVGSGSDGEIQEIAGELQNNYRWLSKPFADGNERQKEILDFAKLYLAEVQKNQISENRIRNLVQAIVRNPILRGDYGSNDILTALRKGSARLMIDTGQFFNSIQARVIKNV